MDYLSCLLNFLDAQEKIKRVRFDEKQNLTHLLLADDILLFIEDNDESIENMKNVVHLFELASGLNVNLRKFFIFPINVDAQRTNFVANKLGITTQYLPIQYLCVRGESHSQEISGLMLLKNAQESK